jgi:hypothetical protein
MRWSKAAEHEPAVESLATPWSMGLSGWPACRFDALGHAQAVELHDGRLTAQVSLTPLFITAEMILRRGVDRNDNSTQRQMCTRPAEAALYCLLFG